MGTGSGLERGTTEVLDESDSEVIQIGSSHPASQAGCIEFVLGVFTCDLVIFIQFY